MSPSTTSSSIVRLSQDVLGMIFLQYSQEESPEFPLETLLLICRSWNQAATSYRSLWGSIKVIIGHKETFIRCKTIAYSRLKRSGDMAPIDIDIRTNMDNPADREDCKTFGEPEVWECCMERASQCAIHILDNVAGPKGMHCKRWRSLKLRPGDLEFVTDDDSSPMLMKSLTYPTINLLDVEFGNFDITSGKILPFCPSLSRISFNGSCISNHPDLSNVQKLLLPFHTGYHLDLSFLETAHRLERLAVKVGDVVELKFPKSISSLTDLALVGWDLGESFSSMQLPNLKMLRIGFDVPSDLEMALNTPGIPFDQLTELSISWEIMPELRYGMAYQNWLIELIQKCPNVVRIIMDRAPLVLLLKTMWIARSGVKDEDWEAIIPEASLFNGRDVAIRSRRGDWGKDVVMSGLKTADELMEIARQRNLLLPNIAWEDIFRNEFDYTHNFLVASYVEFD